MLAASGGTIALTEGPHQYGGVPLFNAKRHILAGGDPVSNADLLEDLPPGTIFALGPGCIGGAVGGLVVDFVVGFTNDTFPALLLRVWPKRSFMRGLTPSGRAPDLQPCRIVRTHRQNL